MKSYHVYIGPLQPAQCKHTYYSSDSGYMILYSDRVPPGEFYRVPLEKEKNLTRAEIEWLCACKKEINRAEIQAHPDRYAEMISEFVSRLENELQNEAEKTGRKDIAQCLPQNQNE